MISYIFKIFSKSIVKGAMYFLFSFVLLLIPLNIGKKNLDKIHTTIVIYSEVQGEYIKYAESILLWERIFSDTIRSIHHKIHVLKENRSMMSNFNDDVVKKVFSDIIITNSNLDEEKIKPNYFNNLNLWTDADKQRYLRYEINYNKDQTDNVKELLEIFNNSFKNLIQKNVRTITTSKIETIKRNEKIMMDEKLNMLNNTRLLNDSANFQINIDYNFKNGDIDPKILQLDAQRFFVDINKKELDNLFRIKVETKNYDWFRSRQYYLGYILIIIISILVSIFFTSNKTKKKL
ncbi:hypothetical protein N9570_06800 [Candidatus Pelagibacter sp.]|nr:hypothetical protein [Candidatus Pelagibacter sp.]